MLNTKAAQLTQCDGSEKLRPPLVWLYLGLQVLRSAGIWVCGYLGLRRYDRKKERHATTETERMRSTVSVNSGRDAMWILQLLLFLPFYSALLCSSALCVFRLV